MEKLVDNVIKTITLQNMRLRNKVIKKEIGYVFINKKSKKINGFINGSDFEIMTVFKTREKAEEFESNFVGSVDKLVRVKIIYNK